jgi:hypothetical protein
MSAEKIMQIVLSKEFVMDQSHGISLAELPISAGERFTVLVLKENHAEAAEVVGPRKLFEHRFSVENVTLPVRDELHER